MKYSLADYILEITLPESLSTGLGLDNNTISIGGEGSYLDNITMSLNSDLWSTNGDHTGGFIHVKNLDRTGTASLNINMLSPKNAQLTTVLNRYYNSDSSDEEINLTLSNVRESNVVVTCNSCYLTKIPALSIDTEPGARTWTFTCGEIIITQE